MPALFKFKRRRFFLQIPKGWVSKPQNLMNFRVQSLKEKYLRGWERQATVVLLASALLLTLHRYYSRRSFFKRHFAEYLSNVPLAESHSYYYWFFDDSSHVVIRPRARCAIRNKGAAEGLRIPTR